MQRTPGVPPPQVDRQEASHPASTPSRRSAALDAAVITALALSASVAGIRSALPDSVLTLDVSPGFFLNHLNDLWSPNLLGQTQLGNAAYLPMALLYSLLKHLGLDLLTIQRLWVGILLTVAGLGAASLYRSFWAERNRVPRLCAATMYMFFPYVLLNLKGATSLLLPYAVAPFFAAWALTVLRQGGALRAAAWGVTLGAIVPAVNLTENAYLYLSLGLVLFAAHLRPPRSRRPRLGLYVWMAIGTGLAALWWLLPILTALGAGAAAAAQVTDPLSLLASASSFLSAFRATGLWALNGSWQGVPYFPAASYLSNGLIAGATLFPAAMALTIGAVAWKDAHVRALLLALTLALLLAVSIYPPSHPSLTGLLLLFAYSHAFVLHALREPYKAEAIVALVMALLSPRLLSILTATSRPVGRYPITAKWSSVPLLVTIVIFAAPFYSGLAFPSTYKLGDIPTYWGSAVSWLNTHAPNGRVLFLPEQGFSIYRWGYPFGDLAAALKLTRPDILVNVAAYSTALGEQLLAIPGAIGTQGQGPLPLDAALNLLHVQYVVEATDANTQYYSSSSPREVIAALATQPDLKYVRRFGALLIYRVEDAPTSYLGVVRSRSPLETISYTGTLADALLAYQPNAAVTFVPAKLTAASHEQFLASSTWAPDPSQYAAWIPFSYRGPLTSLYGWVSNVPYGEHTWLRVTFPAPRRIGTVSVIVRRDGVDALPQTLAFIAGTSEITVRVPPTGTVTAHFGNVVAGSLEIQTRGHTAGAPLVGISQVRCGCVQPLAYALNAPTNGAPYAFVMDLHTPITNGVAARLVLPRRTTFNVAAYYPARSCAELGATQAFPVLINGRAPRWHDHSCESASMQFASSAARLNGRITLNGGSYVLHASRTGLSPADVVLTPTQQATPLIRWTAARPPSTVPAYRVSTSGNDRLLVLAFNPTTWWAEAPRSGSKPVLGVNAYAMAWRLTSNRPTVVSVSLHAGPTPVESGLASLLLCLALLISAGFADTRVRRL